MDVWGWIGGRGRQALSAVALAVLVVAILPAWVGAQEPAPVVVLEVRGVIDPLAARYLERGIAAAETRGARLVVVTLDTPGGLDGSMRQMVQAILNSRVPVAVFVAPPGARAASAGLFITVAADIAAMAPGTNIGAAHPVDLGGGDVSDTMAGKVTNDAVAYIQAIARQRGRNADWVEQAVRDSESLAADEAAERGVVDLVVPDLDGLLAALDGRTLTVGGREVTLDLEGATVQAYPMTALETVAHAIVDPNIAYILLTLGMIALIAELYHPGAIFPGATGVIALLIAFVALGSLPVNWGGVALIVLAILMFILDIKVAGFALSIAGGIAFVLGSLFLFSPFSPAAPSSPLVRVSPWVLAANTLVLVGFFAVVVRAAVKAQRQAALSGKQVVLGRTGIAESALDPVGVVRIGGETWTAEAEDGPVPSGDDVVVVAIDGLRLQVRRSRS